MSRLRGTGLLSLAPSRLPGTALWLALVGLTLLAIGQLAAYRTDILVPPPRLPCSKDCVRFLRVPECGEDARTVGQTFVAPRDRLARIVMWLQGPEAGEEARSGTVIFHLLDRLDGRELRRVSLPADRVQGRGGRYAFTFEPIPDSGGKSYFFFLERQGDPWNAGPPLHVRYEIEGLHYAEGEMYQRGEEAFGGDVAMSVQSRVTYAEFLRSPRAHLGLQLWATATVAFLVVSWRRVFLTATLLWVLLALNQLPGL